MKNIDVSIIETQAALWVVAFFVAIIAIFLTYRIIRRRLHEYKHSRALKIRCFRDHVVLLMQRGLCDDPVRKYLEVERYCLEHLVSDAELGISLAELLNHAVSCQYMLTRRAEDQFQRDCSRHRLSLPQYGQCTGEEWATAVIDLAPVLEVGLSNLNDIRKEHKLLVDYQAKTQGLRTGIIEHPQPVTQAQPLFD